jgi:hypothetical protein
MTKKALSALLPAILFLGASQAKAQAWRDCIPKSFAPGGCDSIAPGGGKYIGPGGGLSIMPGGGLSIGPGGGQSIGPGGGRSIAPGGGLAPDRDWRYGLDPDTMRPDPRADGNPNGLPLLGRYHKSDGQAGSPET